MIDPLTGEEFVPKRSNQRFSCSENRIKYHNNIANKNRKENAFVDKALKQNRMILDKYMKGKSKCSFHEEFLKGAEYDIETFNGMCYTKQGTGYLLYNYILIFEKPYVNVYREN